MKKANALQQSTKPAVKAKEETILTLPAIKIKKEAQASPALTMTVLNTSPDDEERIYKCEQAGCFSSFKSRSSLRDHQKGLSLHRDLSYSTFAINFSLISVHSDERPYACAFCSSAFKSSSNRSKHERGSHTEQYQRRKMLRDGHRNGEVAVEEATPPPTKKIKITLVQSPKVIKQEPSASPKKATNEFPCRYCDRVLKRADNRDKHEATHKDNRAFGELFDTGVGNCVISFFLSRLRVLFKEF